MKKYFFSLIFNLLTLSLLSQKIAFVNRDTIIKHMPEVQKAQKQLYNFIYQAKNELKIMKIQYQQKIYEYNKSKDTLMPIIKNNKIEEIKSLDKRIQNFESEINTEYTKRQKKIDNLINTKINKAIEKVREAENFDIVENITPNILYINPKYDITKKVIKQLQKK